MNRCNPCAPQLPHAEYAAVSTEGAAFLMAWPMHNSSCLYVRLELASHTGGSHEVPA